MREPAPGGETLRTLLFFVQQLIRGRSNATGTVTLTASATTTTVTRANNNANAAVFLMPRTANAAAELGNGTLYRSAIDGDGFTLTHANNAQTDRTFDYIVIGG